MDLVEHQGAPENPSVCFLRKVIDEIDGKSEELSRMSWQIGISVEELKAKRRERVRILIELPERLKGIHDIPEEDRASLESIVGVLAKEAQGALDKASQDEKYEGELENLFTESNRGWLVRVIDLDCKVFH